MVGRTRSHRTSRARTVNLEGRLLSHILALHVEEKGGQRRAQEVMLFVIEKVSENIGNPLKIP
jgi:hypothetical protein